MMQILPLLLLIACVLVGQAARADAAVPYAKLAELQLAFDATPPDTRDKLILRVRVVHADPGDHAPIRMWVMDGGKRLDVKLSDDGALPNVQRDWAERGLQVETDQTKGSLQTRLDLFIKPADGREIPASYLIQGASQAQRAITAGARRIGGYLATLVAPTVHQVDVTLAGCCSGSAQLGGETFRQAASGKIVIPVSALKRHSDGVVAFSGMPVVIDPTD